MQKYKQKKLDKKNNNNKKKRWKKHVDQQR